LIVPGHKVRVTRECWWHNSRGEFSLLGLEGHVYDTDFGEEGPEVYVLIPGVGHVLLTADEVEVID